MKKILIIQNEFNISGSPVAAYNLAKYLRDHNFAVTVVAHAPGPMQAIYAQEKIPAKVLPGVNANLDVAYQEAQQHDLSIVFCMPQFAATIGAVSSRKPTIFAIHEAEVAGTQIARDNIFAQRALNLASALVFNSQLCVNMYKHRHTNQNVRLIPIGSEVPELEKSPKSSDKKIFVQVGSIEGRKGQDVSITAFKLLKDKAELHIIGRVLDPNFLHQLQNLANGLDNVKFLGEMDFKSVCQHIKDSDGLIVSSRDETLPNVVLEAMQLKTPVIATDVGAIREVIVNGETGLLCQNEHAGDLVNAITKLISDDNLAKKITISAHNVVKRTRSLEAYGSKFVALIQELLQTKK